MAFYISVPSRVWKFGCRAPRIDVELIERQFSLAHRYYNNLIETEHWRRGAVDKAIHEYAPALAALEQSIETIAAELRKLREAISQRNQQARKRTGTAQERERVAALEESLKAARLAVKAEREKLWGKPIKREQGEAKPRRKAGEPIRTERDGGDRAFLDAIDQIENMCLARRQALRAGCMVYWGTYLLVERAFEQSCKTSFPGLPRFRSWRFDPVRQIGVQLQGGLSVSDAFAGTDSRLRLVMQSGHSSARGQNGEVWMRIGSDGRKPIWGRFAFRLHRRLPANAVIKWATINRMQQHGRRHTYPYEPIYRYELNLTFSCEDGFAKTDRAESGTVAVNAGFRCLPGGALRVATWLGSDGQRGFLNIPEEDLNRWTKANELRSIRDKNFDVVRDQLSAFLGGCDVVPDWLRDACKHLGQWRGHGRLIDLIGLGGPVPVPREDGQESRARWRENRFAGDEAIFKTLEDWLRQEMHLLDWETNNRRKAIAWRKKYYERFAVDLRRQYKDLRIGKINQKKIAERAAPEEKDEMFQGARFNRTVSSPGLLVSLLVENFGDVNTAKIDPKLLTQCCPFCGNTERWDAAPAITHRCSRCRRVFDQDIGHCMNLLFWEPTASGEVVDEKPGIARNPENDSGKEDAEPDNRGADEVDNDEGEALAG